MRALHAVAFALSLIGVASASHTRASCSDPISVSPGSSVYQNPCDYTDDTASSSSDVVMHMESASFDRTITVEASGIDTELYAYTTCPDSEFGSSRVAYDDDSGTNLGSRMTFTAQAYSSYYLVLEPYNDPENCGYATVTFSSGSGGTASPPPSPSPAPPPQTAPSPSPPPQSSPSRPPDASTGCGSPTTISLARRGDYITMEEDTCALANTNDGQIEHEGVTYTLGSNDVVLKLSAAPERRAIVVIASSSNFRPMVLVSRECSRSQTNDTKVAFEEGRTDTQLSFFAESEQAYFIILEGSGGCGPARMEVEVLGQRASGLQAATCEEPHSVSLGDSGGIYINEIDTCAQANSMDGTITLNGGTETQLNEKDYIIKLEAFDSADREIKFSTGGTNYAPIVAVSEECSTSINQLTEYDLIGRTETDTTSRTFMAKAGVAYYLGLEAIAPELVDYYDEYYDSQPSCGTEGAMELLVVSSSPSLPQLQRTGAAKMEIDVVVDTSFDAVTQSSDTAAAFKDDISTTVARNLYNMEPSLLEENGEVCLQCVTCGALSSGSVVAPITVLFKDDLSKERLSSFTKRIDGTPNSDVFAGSTYQDQIVRFEAIVDEDEDSGGGLVPADSSSDSSAPASVVAPAVVIPVVVVALYITWLFFTHDWSCSGWSCSSFWKGTWTFLFSPIFLIWYLCSQEAKDNSSDSSCKCCSMDQCSSCTKTAWAPFALGFSAIGRGCAAAGRSIASGFKLLGDKLSAAVFSCTNEGKRQQHDEQMGDMEQHIQKLERLIKEDEQAYHAIKRDNEPLLRSQRARIVLSPEQEQQYHQVLVRLETVTQFMADKRGQLTHAQETLDHQRQARLNHEHHKQMNNFKSTRGFKVSPFAYKKTKDEVDTTNAAIRQACNEMSRDELARKHGVL